MIGHHIYLTDHTLLQDGNDENNYEKTFEIVIDDVTDAPPVFTSTFDTRVNEDVPRVRSTCRQMNWTKKIRNFSANIQLATSVFSQHVLRVMSYYGSK